jgi:hypothetical protein
MAVFMKLTSLGLVVGGGSLLTGWLLFGGHVALAWLALAATAALTVGVIVLITRETQQAEQVQR